MEAQPNQHDNVEKIELSAKAKKAQKEMKQLQAMQEAAEAAHQRAAAQQEQQRKNREDRKKREAILLIHGHRPRSLMGGNLPMTMLCDQINYYVDNPDEMLKDGIRLGIIKPATKDD